jgi:V8-like Glu-specific endopeptidase
MIFESSDGNWYGCTGVFIQEDVILTAAHCSIHNGSDLRIHLYKNNSAQYVELAPKPSEFRFERDPSWNDDFGTNDIAIIVLKNMKIPDGFQPAKILPLALASAADLNQTATVIGVGLTEQGSLSDRLRLAQGQFTSHNEDDGVREIQFPSSKGICTGDSGGPVFVTSGKQAYVAAITNRLDMEFSLNDNCANTILANSISEVRRQWIEATVKKLRN